MTDFLIISNISLIVLLAVYHLWLEREKMHNFNRFYLLGALALSLLIPFVTIEIVREVPAAPITEHVISSPQTIIIADDTAKFPVQNVLWAIYVLITAGFLIRFIKNILKFQRLNSQSELASYKTAKISLLSENILPHTFGNRIYVNAEDYKLGKIGRELLEHEMVHVSQFHTADILFIEFLKTIFWFNPVFILYKRAIALNHEFIADSSIVAKYDVTTYQTLLLNTASQSLSPLASNLTFHLTKKRLKMMTKTTSENKVIFRKIALLPIVSALFYFCCVEVVAQEKPTSVQNQTQKFVEDFATAYDAQSIQDARDSYYKGVHVIVRDMDHNQIIIDNVYEMLNTYEKDRYIPAVPQPYNKKAIADDVFKSYYDSQQFAIWIDGKHTANTTLKNFKAADFALATQSFVQKNARSKKFFQPNQVQLYTHSYFENNLKDLHKKYQGDTLKIIHTTKIDKEKREELNAMIEKNKHNISQKVRENEIEEYSDVTQDGIKNTNEINQNPEFPGGIGAFYKFVAENYNVPATVTGKHRIFVQFIIEKDGSLSNIEVIRDAGEGTGAEALRVLELSPKWIPGKIKDVPVRTRYSLPITIMK